ncbi:MAG: TolC family protein [Candidatus Brocadiae bacterium]|nr:TolC family protein [Candidatus Brocadiia bacterium]
MGKSLFIWIVFFLAACQTYKPDPLDLKKHEISWKQRNGFSPEIQEYIKKLSDLGNQSAKSYNLEDGISLEEARLIMLFFNANLRTARLKAQIPAAYSQEAGRWEDPSFSIDAMRVLTSIPHPWVLATSLGITLPVSGRLSVEKKMSHSQADVALQEAYLEEWSMSHELRSKWLVWTETCEKIDTLKKFILYLQDIVHIVQQLGNAGELKKSDARLLELEWIEKKADLNFLEESEKEQRSLLKEYMGFHPGLEVKLIPSFYLPEIAKENPENFSEHPRVQLLALEYQVAENALELEIKKQYPDLTIGGGYEREEGESKLGFGLNMPIPLWNRNQAGIAKALAERNFARAKYEAGYESIANEVSRTRQKLQASSQYYQHLEKELLPKVQEQWNEMDRLTKLGEFNVFLLYETLTRSLEIQIKILDAKLAERLAYNELFRSIP